MEAREQVLGDAILVESIIQHICEIRERLKLRRVSRFFQDLSKTATWKIPNHSFAQLKIRCQEGSSRVLLTHGSYHKYHEGLTQTKRSLLKQVDLQQSSTQPKELMKALTNLLICKSTIKEVIIGGIARDHHYSEDAFELFIVTKDLIEHLNHFANLESLTFEEIEGTEEMQNFVMSEQCFSKKKVTDLKIFNSDLQPGIVEFVGRQTKKVAVKTLGMANFQPLVERLDRMDLHLDQLSIQIGTCIDENIDKAIITRLAERCQRLEIRFVLLDCRKKSQFRALIKNIANWKNITTLEIMTESDAINNAQDMRIIFENIGELHHLENLSISESIDGNMLLALGKSLGRLENLNCFHFSDRWSKKSGVLPEFYTYLPTSLTELSLDSVLWKEEHLESLHQCMRGNLKKLKITKVRRGGMDNFEMFGKLANNLPELRKFHFSEPLPWQAIRYINNHPNLTDIQIFITSIWPDAVTTTLDRIFERVRITPFIDSRKVEIRNRKANPILPFIQNP